MSDKEWSQYAVNLVESMWYIANCYIAQYKHFEMKPHAHAEMQVIYVLEVQCRIFAGEMQYTLKAGEFIVIAGNALHRLHVEEENPCRVLDIMIGVKKAEPGFKMGISNFLYGAEAGKFWKMNSQAIIFRDRKTIFFYHFHNLLRLINLQVNELEIHLQTGLIFCELVREYWSTANSQKGYLSPEIKAVMRFITEHYEDEFTVEDLVKIANLSRSRLQHKFKEETGQTITEQIQQMRMKKAKYLLDTSTLSILQIACDVGFNSRQHFTDVFKKMYGVTPMKYRQSVIETKNGITER